MEKSQLKSKVIALFQKELSERESAQITRWLLEETGLQSFAVDDLIDAEKVNSVLSMAGEILSGKPFDYVVGNSVFFGRKFKVNQHVLIPRPETEELVEICIQSLKSGDHHGQKVLDIGTGSGIIAVTLALECPGISVDAIDVSVEALQIAEQNAKRLGADVHFFYHDILDAASDHALGTYDLIVSNPPYIAEGEQEKMTGSTIEYEPSIALFPPGNDPLLFYRRIASLGKNQLNENGLICLELNEFRAGEIMDLFEGAYFSEVRLLKDIRGKDRMLLAIKS